MTITNFLEISTTPASNIDVNGIGIQGTNFVSNFDNAFREFMAMLRSGLDGKVVQVTKSAGYTAVANDNNAIIRFSAAATLSLTAAATLGANWHILVVADGGAVVIDPNASETVNGSATITIPNGFSAMVWCNGTAFFATKDWSNVQTNYGELYRGQLNGLTLSNNATDATNDIDIASGSAGSDGTTPVLMTLASTLTKRLDATWAVGSGNGGLDTGTIANTTYHVWLIQRSDTGVVDALFSTSATSPTMPSGYDRKRRIGSILRESGAIVSFVQRGNRFTRPQSVDRNSTAAVTDTLITLKVPTTISVQPIISCAALTNAVAGQATIYIGDGSDTVAPYRVFILGDGASVRNAATIYGGVYTNGSAQIRYTAALATTTFAFNLVETYGWIDTRGQE